MADEKKSGGTYIIQKRSSDDKWELKVMGGEKVIKLFNTKKEAEAYAKERADRNDRSLVKRASKGEHKGKFQK